MCGICGVIGSDVKNKVEQFKRLLLQNESRGRMATGVIVVQKDGQNIYWAKTNAKASVALYHSEFKRIFGYVDENTYAIIGHTRNASKGSPKELVNNHPIIVGNVLGVHNGVIYNDYELYAEKKFARNGEVDSEIIFALLNNVTGFTTGREYREKCARELAQLTGWATIVWADLRVPNRVLFMRRDCPLKACYDGKNIYISSLDFEGQTIVRDSKKLDVAEGRIYCLYRPQLLASFNWKKFGVAFKPRVNKVTTADYMTGKVANWKFTNDDAKLKAITEGKTVGVDKPTIPSGSSKMQDFISKAEKMSDDEIMAYCEKINWNCDKCDYAVDVIGNGKLQCIHTILDTQKNAQEAKEDGEGETEPSA